MHILDHPSLSNQALEILPMGLTLVLNFSQYQTKVFCTEGMHCKDKAQCNSLWEKKKKRKSQDQKLPERFPHSTPSKYLKYL